MDGWESFAPAPYAQSLIEDERKAVVTYRNEDGKRFKVIVRQKPNPIGFRARLPGDKRD